KALAELVPELGIPIQVWMAGIPPKEEQIRDWYDWLGMHKDQLSRLEPSEARILSRADCMKLRAININPHDVRAIYIAAPSKGRASAGMLKYTIVNRHDKFFVGNQEVDETALSGLLAALESPVPDPLSLADLGISSEWLTMNAAPALKSLSPTP